MPVCSVEGCGAEFEQKTGRGRPWKKCPEHRSAPGTEEFRRNRRDKHLQRAYGITLSEYDAILEQQDGRCAICRTTVPGHGTENFAVDHCHDSLEVRGLLCVPCNVSIGAFGHDSNTLLAAIAYLNQSRR